MPYGGGPSGLPAWCGDEHAWVLTCLLATFLLLDHCDRHSVTLFCLSIECMTASICAGMCGWQWAHNKAAARAVSSLALTMLVMGNELASRTALPSCTAWRGGAAAILHM